MRNKIIVLGGNHVNTLGLIRSLGRVGHRCDVALERCDLAFCPLRFSKYIDRLWLLDDAKELVNFLLEHYGAESEKVILLCASDPYMAVMDQGLQLLADRFVVFNANQEPGRISYLMNKANTFPIAESCGLTTIKTWRVTNALSIPHDIVYPCIVKGNNSLDSHKEDMFVCRTAVELREHIMDGTETLVQEYIEKEYEIDVNGISINHGRDILIPGVVRKIREELDRQSDYIVLESVPAGLDLAAIKRFVAQIGYEGLFSVEFMKRGDKFYFLEINLRNDGVNYLYTQAGVNMPSLWVQYAKGEVKDFATMDLPLKTSLYLMQLFDVLNLKSGKVGLCAWLRDFVRAHGHFVMSLRDPKPFLYLVWIYIRQAGRRMKKVCHI